MKNTIIKYTKEELDEYIVSDYFSKDIYVYDVISEISQFLEIYLIDNNDQLENISYKLYGTADYWDVLLLVNNRDPLFQMPFDYDYIENARDKTLESFSNTVSNLTEDKKKEFGEKFLEKLQEENESYRFIYVVKRQNINDVLTLFKEKGYL